MGRSAGSGAGADTLRLLGGWFRARQGERRNAPGEVRALCDPNEPGEFRRANRRAVGAVPSVGQGGWCLPAAGAEIHPCKAG